MKPVISVIFTAGSGVETCRTKLAGQTFKEYEIIEADRFAGIERAHGEYILFVDGSEVYPENMLEKLHDAAEQSGADMVISNCELIDSDGGKTFGRGIHFEWVHGGKQVFNWKDCRGRIMNVVRPLVGNKLYRKQFIIDAGLGIAGCDSEAIYSAIGAVAAEKIAYISNLTFSRNVVPESEAEKLPDVPKTVDCVTEHVKGMADRTDLWNAVMYFAIRQYVDNYEKYCRELDSAERIEFYEKAHSVFNSEIFDGLTEKGLNDDKLFRKYSIIKKHDSSELKKLKTRRIIVSLTSYPARIAGIAQMLESIYSQTRKADKIVLWLAEEQFPNRDDDLPDDLRKLQFEDKLEVRWCDDLKPHKKSIKDIMTGYRAFSYEFVKTYPVMSKGFEIETEMSIHAVDRNMQVENVIIEYRDRPDGSESKLNTYSDGIKVLLTIVKLYKNYKPFGFFTAISLVLALCSILFFIPVLSAYFKTGVVDRFPTLIVCGFVMVMAILFFAVGVLLSTLRSQDKRDFEYKLIQVDHMKKTSK